MRWVGQRAGRTHSLGDRTRASVATMTPKLTAVLSERSCLECTRYPNDMVVDDQGLAFVGNFGFDLMGGADVRLAMLLRVDPDGSVTEVAEELWLPNGSVITDGGVLLVDETFGNRVTAFDIEPDGSLSNRSDRQELTCGAVSWPSGA
jgi:sugar lactone lactonase YvrE